MGMPPRPSRITSTRHQGRCDDAAQDHRDDPRRGLSAGDVSHNAGGCYGVAWLTGCPYGRLDGSQYPIQPGCRPRARHYLLGRRSFLGRLFSVQGMTIAQTGPPTVDDRRSKDPAWSEPDGFSPHRPRQQADNLGVPLRTRLFFASNGHHPDVQVDQAQCPIQPVNRRLRFARGQVVRKVGAGVLCESAPVATQDGRS